MIIYRVARYSSTGDFHNGFRWYLSRLTADNFATEWINASASTNTAEVDKFNLPLRQLDVVRFLNNHADHPDA